MSEDTMSMYAAMLRSGAISPQQMQQMGMDPMMVMGMAGDFEGIGMMAAMGGFGGMMGGFGGDDYDDDDYDDDGEDDEFVQAQIMQMMMGRGRGGGGRGGYTSFGPPRGGGGGRGPPPPPSGYCGVCDFDVGAANMATHLAGKKHKAAVEKVSQPKPATKAAKPEGKKAKSAPAATPAESFCDVCQMTVATANMPGHIGGKKHQKAAARQEEGGSSAQPAGSAKASAKAPAASAVAGSRKALCCLPDFFMPHIAGPFKDAGLDVVNAGEDEAHFARQLRSKNPTECPIAVLCGLDHAKDATVDAVAAFIKLGGIFVLMGDAQWPRFQHHFPTLQWTSGGYYRTTVDITPAGRDLCGAKAPSKFSSKCVWVAGAPASEQLYVTTSASQVQSLVPIPGHRIDVGMSALSVHRPASGGGALLHAGDVNIEGASATALAGALSTLIAKPRTAAAAPAANLSKKQQQQQRQQQQQPQPGPRARGHPSASATVPAWFDGMSKDKAIMHVIDAYRLRVEDTYTQTGDLRGIYDHNDRPSADRAFARFLRDAGKKAGLLPPWWNDAEAKRVAKAHIYYAIEASDLLDEEHGYDRGGVASLRTLADRVEGPIGGGDSLMGHLATDDMFTNMMMMEGGGAVSHFQALQALLGRRTAEGGWADDDDDDTFDDDEEEEEFFDDDDDEEEEDESDDDKAAGGGGTIEVLDSDDDDGDQAAASGSAKSSKPAAAYPQLHKAKNGAYTMTREDLPNLGVPIFTASNDAELALLDGVDVRILVLSGNCTPAAVRAMAARFPHLQHVEARNAALLTPDGIVALAAACPLLEVVGAKDVAGFGETHCRALIDALPRLKLVDLRGTPFGARLKAPDRPQFNLRPGILIEL